MDYMFQAGFLGTRAPIFMDVVTLIVALLPLLVFGAISFAIRKKYKAHAISQIIIFVISVIVFTYFEVGVRVGGGFDAFMEGSTVSHNYAFIVLIIHIVIAVITLFLWTMTILRVKKHLANNKHKKMARATFTGIVLTSLSGIWVYLLLFVY